MVSKSLGLILGSLSLLSAAGDTRLLVSFEATFASGTLRTINAKATQTGEHATDGRQALRMTVEAEQQGVIELPMRKELSDWAPFRTVAVDVTNGSKAPAELSIEVEDRSGGKSAGETVVPLLAGESISLALPLNAPGPLDMGMRGEPSIPGFSLLVADHKPVNLRRIALVRISVPKSTGRTILLIDNVRLAPAVSYSRISDQYGQFSKATWPGKLTDHSDFAARKTDEQRALEKQPTLAGRDEYGGWAAGPQLKATGYFRSEKRNGKWWLVTPAGHLFFSLGLNSVNYVEGSTVTEGREQMFEWLPDANDPLAAHRTPMQGEAPLGLKIKLFSGKGLNFYTANLERKYGRDWQAAWSRITLERLPAWGFNTIANWSDQALYDAKRVPYTATLSIEGKHGRLSSGSDYWIRMHDSFDPLFAESVEKSVTELTRQRRDDPWCIGYFVDNELPWGGMRNPRSRFGLALGALSLGSESPAKVALVAQLKASYESVEKLNEAWGTHVDTWETLAKPLKWEDALNTAMQRDLGKFVGELATRYFRTIRDALKKHDPNHIYLGTRFAWYTTEEVRAAGEYCDVVSFNIYQPHVEPSKWAVFDEIDKPIIIGEFHMGALDRGMFHTGLVATRDQRDRARQYQQYVRSVAAQPKLVGCHFFKYVDEPLTGRPGDGENYNIGFVTITDTPYPEMVEAAKDLHSKIYTERDQK